VRVAIIDTYYPAFLAAQYAGRKDLSASSYEEQHAALMEQCFGTSDAYSQHLRELGHEAIELVANCPELQGAWAREHGSSSLVRRLASLPTRVGLFARRQFLRSVVQAQVEAFEPDVLYAQDLWFLSGEQLDAFRGQGRLVVGQIASPAPPADALRRFDLITTSFPHFVARFRALGVDSEYLRIGFYERVLERLRARAIGAAPGSERPYGATFVGGLNPSVHAEGTALLERLATKLHLEVWGYGAAGLPRTSSLRVRHHGEAWGTEMYEVLARSQISVNRHIEAAEGYANNMRMFETTGVGALLLTEDAPNLRNLFEPDQEVVAYESEDDLVEKVHHYLEHDEERLNIAAAGQARTLAEHTYARRMAELAEMLESRLRQ
jgi:spore maturation protein CgeB